MPLVRRALPWKNLALGAATLAAVLVLAEGILRTTHLAGARVAWTEPDTLIGWRFTPGRPYWFHKENDHPVTGRINARGWRDRERTLVKGPGVYRVAVVGDSYVEAFQVELDSTFTQIAERALAGREDVAVEVLNFGRSGMTQTEELLVLERDVLPYQPDLVVVVFVPLNDIDDMDPATTFEPLRPFFQLTEEGELALDRSFARTPAFRARRRVGWLKQRSALVSLVAERTNARALARRKPPPAPGAPRPVGYLSLCTDRPEPRYVRGYELCKRVVSRIAGACEAGGASLLLVCANGVYDPGEVAALRRASPSFYPGFFGRDLCRWAAWNEIACVDLQPAFAARFEATGERLHWAHWNYAGHRVVAQALIGAIAERIP